MLSWNLTGFLGLFVGMGVGMVTAGLLSHFLGESTFTKGIGFIAGGSAMIIMDLILRLRHDKIHGFKRLFSGEFGAVTVFPMWCFGIVAILGGVKIMSGEQ